jgi:hypothetical protein
LLHSAMGRFVAFGIGVPFVWEGGSGSGG